MTLAQRSAPATAILLACLVLSGPFSPAPRAAEIPRANTGNVGELFRMPLADLLKVQIFVAAKTPEPKQIRSAEVTSYSAKQLRHYGYYSIEELAGITPGFAITTQSGEVGLATRGLAAPPFENNRHLLLIDGIPVRHARSARMQIQEEVPLFFADTVEFLTGPASALYGSSAMSGVVNIIPRQPDNDGASLEARLSGANVYDGWQGMANAWFRSPWSTTTISAGAHGFGGTEQLVHPETSPLWQMNNERRSRFLFAKHERTRGMAAGITGGLIYSVRTTGLGRGLVFQNRLFFPHDRTTWEILIPYVKYEHEFSENVKFSSYLSFNQSKESALYSLPPGISLERIFYRSITEAFEFQGEVAARLAPQTRLILGVNYDSRRERGQPDTFFSEVRSGVTRRVSTLFPTTTPWYIDMAVFGQLQHRFDILAGTYVTAGLRYTKVEASELESNNVSPRISIVQKLSDAWALRLGWNNAYRSPNLKEAGRNLENATRFGIPEFTSLEAEVFTSYTLGLGYTRSDLDVQLNLFANEINDAITRASVSTQQSTTNVNINLDDSSGSWGGELAATMRLTDEWSASASYA